MSITRQHIASSIRILLPVTLCTLLLPCGIAAESTAASSPHADQRADPKVAAMEKLGARVLRGAAGRIGFAFFRVRLRDSDLAAVEPPERADALLLIDTRVTEQGLDHLQKWTALTSLRLSGTRFSDSTIGHLTKLPGLRSLWLDNTQVTDIGVQSIVKNLPSLEVLSLVNDRITDAGLQGIATMKHLRDLDLSGTLIADAGVAYIKDLPELRFLSLRETAITDRSLEYLATCGTLADLWLLGTQVTEDLLPSSSRCTFGLLSCCVRSCHRHL